MADAVRLTGKFSRLGAAGRFARTVYNLFARRSSPTVQVGWDCTALGARDGLPDTIAPYPVRVDLPETMLAAFRANPFAIRPDASAGVRLYQALFPKGDALSAVQRLFAPRDVERLLLLQSDTEAFQVLADVPWEFLAASQEARPFGADPDVSLVRTVDIGKPGTVLAPSGPLRIAHIICNDHAVGKFDDEAIAVHGRLLQLYERLRPAVAGVAIGDPANVPSLDRAGEVLGAFRPHVLFFMGHGRAEKGRTDLRFTRWEPIEDVVARFRNATSDLAMMLLVACNTAHTGGGWDGSLPTGQMGVPALLDSGPAAVCAMQAAYSAINAVPFIDVFLRSMFRDVSLPAAFNHARRQSHWQGIFTDASGWAVPLLFVNAQNVDRSLGLHESLQAYGLVIRQQFESFADQTSGYVARAAVDAWLDGAFANVIGLAVLEADADAGSTTSVVAAARRRWEAGSAILAGEPAGAGLALPRPFFYVDAAVGGNAGLASLLGAFGPRTRQLIGGWNSALLPRMLQRELNTVADLVELIAAAGACVVIDHAHALEPALREEVAQRAAGLRAGAVLLVERPGHVKTLGATRARLTVLSQAECVQFANTHGRSAADGVRWHVISGGRAHDLQLLASGVLDAVTRGGGASPPADVRSALDRIADRWPDEFALARFCAFFPQGLCRRWLPSLGLPNESAVGSAAALGLVTEFTLEDLPWIRVAPRYQNFLLERIEANDRIKAANVALDLLRRLTGRVEWLSSRTATRPPLPIVQTFRAVAELLLHAGSVRQGGDIARGVYQVERIVGRHLGNEASMLLLLGAVPMAKWQAGDLLRLSVAAHGLGHTALHGAVLAYIDTSGLHMTQLERITFLVQRASYLKDDARTDAIDVIRALYREADSIAAAAPTSADAGDRDEFMLQSAIVLYNWGVAERYFGDPVRALDLLRRAQEAYAAAGRPVEATTAAVERVGAELDLPGHAPDWPALERELVERTATLAALGDSSDLAFAYYQRARLYRKRPAPDRARAADAYRQAAEIAARVGDFRIQGAALKHYATLAAELGLLSAAEIDRKLNEAIVLLESAFGDAWATRVRRDAWAARCSSIELRLEDRREAWRNAVETAMIPPLRPDRSTGDRRRLLALFADASAPLIDPALVDRAWAMLFPDRASSSTRLADLRALAQAQT
jgi:hypothetical protein